MSVSFDTDWKVKFCQINFCILDTTNPIFLLKTHIFAFFFLNVGAVVAIYKDRVSLNCLLEFVCKQSNVLETLGMEDSEYWIDAVALLSIFIGLRILGYFVLLFKVYSLR